MLFTSFAFGILFCVTFALYYLPPLRRYQVAVLLAASLVFYAWSEPWLLTLLLASIALNTLTSFGVARASERRTRLVYAVTGVAANIGLLVLFKYGALLTGLFLDAAGQSSDPADGLVSLLLHLPLPIGISFYTFEGISLVVDTWRGRERAAPGGGDVPYVERMLRAHAVRTALFVAFFPHLIAGPVLKAHSFYPQIGTKRLQDVRWSLVVRALIIGYFLKMVVADNLQEYTYWIAYPYYQVQGTITNLVLLFGYSMQIFADFAGYSLIAVGLGDALGYDLMRNFNFPYISRSLAEFWRRWHISLSTWLRDYLYIPLGGNRKGEARTYLNLLIVMTLGGIWHGAAWSYAVWGIYHGLGLAVERMLGLSGERQADAQPAHWTRPLSDGLRVLATFSFVSIGWVLFKLPDFGQALDFFATLARNIRTAPNLNLILPVLLLSLPVLLYHARHFPGARGILERVNAEGRGAWGALARDGMVAAMLTLIVLNGGRSQAFIYFQF